MSDDASVTMRPTMGIGASPPFHELGEYVYQDLCRDVFDAELSVSSCEVYGVRGEGQDGIDLHAYRRDGDGIEVGQCKCYADFPPAEIRAASDEFFDHWGRWSKEVVRRFILFVASGLNTRQRRDEIERQRKRFDDHGIVYEVWSAAKLRNKLRPQPGIVATYCKPESYWVPEICGVPSPTYSFASPSNSQSTGVVVSVLEAQLEQLGRFASTEVGRRVEEIRDAWREGRRDDANRRLTETRGDTSLWTVLSSDVKAKLLRLEASLELDQHGVTAKVEQLASNAGAIASSNGDVRLQALIVLRKDGVQQAIDLLADLQDIDSVTLRAGLLLQAGRVDDCLQTLDVGSVGAAPGAEAFRIRALAHMVRHDLGQARLEAAKASERAPRWESVQWTAAVIDYFSSLSPSALPDFVPLWPWPVDWALVKRDHDSLQRRRRAAVVFLHLAGLAGNKEDRQRLEAWNLACLACDPERQESAVEYCRALLSANPSHYQAIAWATTRNYEVDLSSSRVALRELVDRKLADVPEVLALVSCYLASRQFEQARQLLSATRESFVGAESEAAWVLWYAKTFLQDGDLDAALAVVDRAEQDDGMRFVKAAVLREMAREKDDARGLIGHLEASYATTGDPLFLLGACEWMAEKGEWVYVAERAQDLVDRLQTGDVLGLAATAAYNARRYELCLSLLDDHLHLFNGSILPIGLRRLRAVCQQAMGRLSEALVDADSLVRDDPSTRNLLAMAHIQQGIGDLRGLAVTARRLVGLLDLEPVEALRIASVVRVEDAQLAVALWRDAVGHGLPDDLVGTAVGLAFQLGLDREVGALTARMMELGHHGQGGIQVATIEDLLSMARRHQDRMAQLNQVYLAGTAPIHFIADDLRLPLVILYHRCLAESEAAPEPLRRPFLLARHGSRPMQADYQAVVAWSSLYVDVTAFLLGEHLQILDQVEIALAPMRIPDTLVDALLDMRSKLEPHQPARIEASQAVIEMVDRGSLKVVEHQLATDYGNPQLVEEMGVEWVSLFEAAKASDAHLVGFLPLRKLDLSGPPSALPDDAPQRLSNIRALVQSMREHGPLSDEQYAQAMDALGTEGRQAAIGTLPEYRARLYLDGNIPGVLARAGLLNLVSRNFDAFVEKRELDQIRQEVAYYQDTARDVRWLDNLIERVRRGITNEIYQPVTGRAEEGAPEHLRESAAGRCLLTVLNIEAEEGDAVWVDDRFVSAFASVNGARIVGITDVLLALRGRGAVDDATYFAKLSQLRAANVRFVPLTSEEVLYHLGQARVENGQLIETDALSTLRRYVAACLVRGQDLQRPPLPENSPNRFGEIEFILEVGRAIVGSVGAIWERGVVDDVSRAQSDWVVANLFLTHLQALTATSMKRVDQPDSQLEAMGLVGLISQGSPLSPRPRDGGASLRQSFFAWLSDAVLEKRLSANPGLVAVAADLLKRVIVSQIALEEDTEPLEEVQLRTRSFVMALPKDLRAELEHDSGFMARIGLGIVQAVPIGDLQFDADGFWMAASEAVNGRSRKVALLDSDQEVMFEPGDGQDARASFRIVHPRTGQRLKVNGAEMELLRESPEQRESALWAHADWFDQPREFIQEMIADIVTTESPRERVRNAVAARNRSATIYYEGLRQKLSRNETVTFGELRPADADGLAKHFRLAATIGTRPAFREGLSVAAQTLLQHEGLPQAVKRLAAFPTPLPASVVDAFRGLDDKTRRSITRQLLKMVGSPVSRLHVARLLASVDEASYLRLARKILTQMLGSTGTEETQAFLAILKWVNNNFERWADARAWSGPLRLAMVWAHTHELHSAFAAANADWGKLRRGFGIPWSQIPTEWFERLPDYWFDVAHPRRVGQGLLQLAGVSYALADRESDLADEGLQTLLGSHVFTEGHLRPETLSLLRDPSMLENGLSSFLGVDRAEILRPLIGVEPSQLFSTSSTVAELERAIEKLEENGGDLGAWALLNAVLGDSPQSEALSTRLRAAWRSVDFVALFRSDRRLGTLALQTVCPQLGNLEDEILRSYVREQLVEFARLSASTDATVASDVADEEDMDIHYVAQVLLEAAMNTSVAPGRCLEQVMAEFVGLALRLSEVCPTLDPLWRPVIELLSEDLPIAFTGPLSPLLVRLRAS